MSEALTRYTVVAPKFVNTDTLSNFLNSTSQIQNNIYVLDTYDTTTEYTLSDASSQVEKTLINGTPRNIIIKTNTGTTELTPSRYVLDLVYEFSHWDIESSIYNDYIWYPSRQTYTAITDTTVTTNGFGEFVKISADGNMLICGSRPNSTGLVRIYDREEDEWVYQDRIYPINESRISSLCLSYDGTIITFITHTTLNLYTYQYANGAWTQLGTAYTMTTALATITSTLSMDMSADGLTIAVGCGASNTGIGSTVVLTRSGSVWTKQGSTLVGTGNTGNSAQGSAVSLSIDGNILVVGGSGDNTNVGAIWVFTRTSSTWSQLNSKLVGTGNTGASLQGISVAISVDGNTIVVGGSGDNSGVGAMWVYYLYGFVYTQLNSKITASDTTGAAGFGNSVCIANNGHTICVSGVNDNSNVGAIWTFIRRNNYLYQKNLKLTTSGISDISYTGSYLSMTYNGGMIASSSPTPTTGKGSICIFS